MIATLCLALLVLSNQAASTSAGPSTGVTGHVVGRVVSDTGAPVEHAIVSIRADNHPIAVLRVTTDASGTFATDLPARDGYVVDVSATGFFAITGEALPNDAKELRLVLSPIRDFAETV